MILFHIESILVGFIGRPILTLIKWLRWPLLLMGIFFNSISTYNPQTQVTTEQFTIVPFVIGLILFSIGSTVMRYDQAYSEYVKQELIFNHPYSNKNMTEDN